MGVLFVTHVALLCYLCGFVGPVSRARAWAQAQARDAVSKEVYSIISSRSNVRIIVTLMVYINLTVVLKIFEKTQ